MTVAARALRLDEDRWRWLADEATPGGAALVVLGAYLVFAFDRFGWPDFALRPTTRLVLTGFYGWLWLAGASWVVTRIAFAGRTSLTSFVRLTGHAHLPLLLLAAFIQFVSVMLNATNVARWPALFVGAFWVPALLVNAVSAASGLGRGRASLAVGVPYLVWAAVVGRLLWRQLGHLL